MLGELRSVLAGLLVVVTTAAFGGDLGTEQEQQAGKVLYDKYCAEGGKAVRR